MGVIIAIVKPQSKSAWKAWPLFFFESRKYSKNSGSCLEFFNPHPPRLDLITGVLTSTKRSRSKPADHMDTTQRRYWKVIELIDLAWLSLTALLQRQYQHFVWSWHKFSHDCCIWRHHLCLETPMLMMPYSTTHQLHPLLSLQAETAMQQRNTHCWAQNGTSRFGPTTQTTQLI